MLILPEGSLNAPDSSGGKLEEPGGFARFMAEAMAALKANGVSGDARLGRVILSGHSGAYRVISAIVQSGGLPEAVRELYLFDALYGQTDRFQRWFESAPDRRLVVIYADTGGTLEETKKFIATMGARKTAPLITEEPAVSDPQLRTNRLVILHSSKGHNEVLSTGGNFRRFLETGALDPVSAAE